ncbi:MAG: 6-hydroxymethylpterin diphosphokinase MptE-like protein [Rhodospirillales bacterium]
MTVPDPAKLKSRNLVLFKRCTPERVFQRLKNVRPKWRLQVDGAGQPALMADGHPVLGAAGTTQAGGFKPGSVIRFTAKPPEGKWIDVYTYHFLEAALRRATEEGIRFLETPATTDAYFLVVFGIGLGRHIGPLIEKTKARNVILVEPEIEFLWHSLEITDWIELIGGVQARGGDVDFILTDDANEISGNIWRTLRRTNPCAADGFICCVHHHGHLVGMVIEDLKKDVSLITAELGFFYDETLMLWNTHQNFAQRKAKLFSPSPGKKRDLPAFVVGSGPSLDGAIDVIHKNQKNAVIISCGSALRPLILKGIRPDFHIELENLDVSPVVSQVAREHDLTSIRIVASSTVDPGALAPFGDAVFYFRYSLSSFPLFCTSDDAILHLGGPTVTNAGLSFAQQVGFRDIYLFGVDMGARSPEVHHAADSYHFTPEAGPMDSSEFRIPVDANFGGTCMTTRGLYTARLTLIGAISRYRAKRRYFNCSDGAAIDGATPTRPEDLSLPERTAPKEETVRGIVQGFPGLAPEKDGNRWQGDVIAETIRGYMAELKRCLGAIEDFTDKTYLIRLMDVFKPQLGYVDPPPMEPAVAVNFLFRGTLLGMFVFFEYYLARVGDREAVNRFGEIARGELFRRLDELEETAIDALGGPAPKEPPPFSEILEQANRKLPPLIRIPRNDPCPCGSGRKYKHCHGVAG